MDYIPNSVQDVEHTLSIYRSIGVRIAEEYATIDACKKEAEICAITLPPINMSGLPGGKGTTGDKTADMALSDRGRYYLNAIQECYKKIELLEAKRSWAIKAMDSLGNTDRRILELKLVGPRNDKERAKWRPKTYNEIAKATHYSSVQIRRRYQKVIKLMLTRSRSKI